MAPAGRPVVLAIVPARGGSKGLPRKNLLPLDGHPLIAWSIAAGLESELVDRVLCSTDDPQIAEMAARYGAEVPFLRPAELAQDDTLDLPVFQHALSWLEQTEHWLPGIVVQLRPTSPLRFPGQVDRAVRMLVDEPRATGVRTVVPAPANPYKMWLIPDRSGTPWMQPLISIPGLDESFNMPRQALPRAYWHTGTIDAVRADVIRGGRMSGDRLLPMIVDPRQSIDIDTAQDLTAAADRARELACVRPRTHAIDPLA